MISVAEAKKAVQENTGLLPPVSIPLRKATGLILAKDVYSKIDFPPFDQSSMDGYAFRYKDWNGSNQLTLIGEIPAGTFYESELKPGEIIRIFTGSPLPSGADTVIMQENVSVVNDRIEIKEKELKEGAFVRKRGAQTSSGGLALKAYSKLNPAGIAFLASLGIAEVSAFPNPKVTIITTGNELKQQGNELEKGEVYECNSYALLSALKQIGIDNAVHIQVEDNEEQIILLLKNVLADAGIIMVTGGVSVGKYDFVTTAFEKCGVKKIFHHVKQKPGNPFYFGKYKETLLFGLPGNPYSVLCCYYEYVFPSIKKMTGHTNCQLPTVTCRLSTDITKKTGLTYFVIGTRNHNETGKVVTPLPYRESYQLSSFAVADCIIQLDEERTGYQQGETVSVHILPFD